MTGGTAVTQPVRTRPGDWPADTTGCAGWDDLPEPVRISAVDLALEVLWALSGRRFGLTTVTVRPVRHCADGRDYWSALPDLGRLPYGALAAAWCGCLLPGCGCTARRWEVSLAGPVHDTVEVRVDGTVLPPPSYLVHDHRWLVRVDGKPWPDRQDLTAAADQPGTFQVIYRRGVPASAGGRTAAGQYAYELGLAMVGDNRCRLPRRVASVVRQGVRQDFADPVTLAKDGMTGLPDVDRWLRVVNPGGLPRDSVVWSPDLARPRTVTS